MFIMFVGPSCGGKSSTAKVFQEKFGLKIYTGKDYLRLAKSETDAWKVFTEICQTAKENKQLCSHSVIYIASETDKFSDLAKISSFTVHFDASQEILEKRFAPRTGGFVPPPIKKMIEKQKNNWLAVEADFHIDTTESTADYSAEKVLQMVSEREV